MPDGISHGRNIATSTLWQVGSQAAMAALSIITVKMVAVGLSKELAGNYHSAYGFLQLFGILADFGLYAVAVREVARSDRKEETMGALVVLRFLITLLSLGAALLLVWIMPAWHGTPLPLGVTIASLVPFFTLMAGIQRTVFQVSYRMKTVFVAEVSQRIVTVLLIGAVMLLGIRGTDAPWVYHAFLAAGGAGALVLFLISTVAARRIIPIRPVVDRILLKKYFFLAAPYGFAFLCVALYRQLDVTLIALLRDDYELQNAYYGFALRAVEMAYLIPTFLLNSTLPILAERDGKGEDTRSFLGKTFLAILLLGLTAALLSFFWARPLMLLLTRPEYVSGPGVPVGSDTALRLLALPMFLNGIVLFSFYSLLTRHAWKPLVMSLLAGAVLSLILNILLILRFGFVGAAWTSIIIHLFLSFLLLPQALKVLPMRISSSAFLRVIGYGLLLAAILFAARPLLTTVPRTVIALLGAGLWIALAAWMTGIQGMFAGTFAPDSQE